MTKSDEQAEALRSIATWLKYLGTGDAGTTMGAIECLAMCVKESNESIARAIGDLADAVRELAEASTRESCS